MYRNTRTSYGWLSIVLHWLMALGFLGLFGLGLYMVELSYYDAWYKGSLDLHKAIGISLVPILALRIGWRIYDISPDDLPGVRWQQQAAHGVHFMLYLLMFLVLLSGYLISTADGLGIDMFELLTVPALPWAIDNQEDLAGEIHEVLAWAITLLAALHAIAALKHQLVNKDNGLRRILKPN